MYKGKTILATICARGGSKGVRNKNIRLLNGKPVIVYSLENVKNSNVIDEYIVSTESEEIIQVVKDAGFDIRFKRPSELAGDKISRIDAIRHAVKWFEQHNNKVFDVIVDIGVATPLKNSEDLDNSVKLLIDSNAGNVFSVCHSVRNPYYNMVEVIDSKVRRVKELGVITDRRDAPDVYDMNDAYNVWKHDVLFAENCQFNENTSVYVMPRERSIDLDEEEDFLIAEHYLNKSNLFGKSKTNLLENKVIVIAGGCGRIGEKFIEAVIENKGTAIVGDINKEKFDKIASKYNCENLFFSFLNITDKSSIASTIAFAVDRFGKIDGFVNTSFPQTKSAGQTIEKIEVEDFNENINVHLGGYYLCSQQFALYFKERGYGNIVNVSSIQGIAMPKFDTYEGISINGVPMISEIDYTCVKHAIIAMTKYMAKYYKNSNIRFNCISPGGIKENQPEEFLKRYQKYCLTKGMLESNDLKGVFLFLFSDLSTYINGQNIIVDDGWSL